LTMRDQIVEASADRQYRCQFLFYIKHTASGVGRLLWR
jgi:hypothetical protein